MAREELIAEGRAMPMQKDSWLEMNKPDFLLAKLIASLEHARDIKSELERRGFTVEFNLREFRAKAYRDIEAPPALPPGNDFA